MPIKNIQTWKDLSKSKKKKKKRLKESMVDEDIYKEKEDKNQKESQIGIENNSVLNEKKTKEKELSKKIPHPFPVRWLVLVVFLGAVIAWLAGWWIFSVSNPQAAGSLTMKIESLSTISSGEEVKLRLVIDNQEKDDLQDLEVTWHWPEGTRFISSSEPAVEGSVNTWTLPDVPRGKKYVLEVTLQIFGEPGEEKDISSTLMYSLSNFSSVFYIDANKIIEIKKPLLTVDLSGSTELEPLENSVWYLTITNSSEQVLNGILEIDVPESLEDVQTDPASSRDKNNNLIFEIDKLPRGDNLKVKIEGLFAAGSQGEHEFIWRYKKTEGEETHILQEGNFKVYVIGDEVELNILLNKKEKLSELNWGDEVEFEFLAKNITAEELTDGEWQINLPGDLFEWNSLSSNFSPIVERPGLVRFTATDNEVLQSLNPGEEKRISFKLKLKSSPIADNHLNVQAKFLIKAEKDAAEKISFSRSFDNVLIKPLLKWHVSAHYYDDEGAAVGSGPLPPQVGQATTYRIQFNISDFSQRIKKIIFSTVLPSEIIWAGEYKVNYGIISFSPQTRQVQWVVNSPSTYDISQGELTAYFDVRLVPNQQAVGSILPLTGSVQVQAYESDGQIKNFSAPMLTTSLSGDLYGQGKGIVQDN